jgi:hypothetical protein
MSIEATCRMASGEVMRCVVEGVNAAVTPGLVLFLFGVFCAYWAMSSRRSGVLWFFLGLLFGPLTGIALLINHSNDMARVRAERSTT